MVIVSELPATATTSVIAADFVCAGFPLSVTLAVKLNDPLEVGVPEITPLARLNPAGKLPEVIDHAYPGVPPLACNACE